jgi:membrane-associated phospholipid phosphatase
MEEHVGKAVRAAGSPAQEGRRPRLRKAADVPALEARSQGLAEKAESLVFRLYPFVVSFATANVLSLVLSAIGIVFGVVLTNFILRIGVVDRFDVAVPDWLEAQRTPLLDDLSYLGSMFGADLLVLLVIVTALAFAVLRHWRIAGFVLAAILVEVTSYRLIAGVVDRQRPDVAIMDDLNPTHSFPSGHTAASVAIYGALALLLSSRIRVAWAGIAIWSVAIAIPVVVALSRLYRGDHHPTDVAGGALLGVASLVIAVFATRAAVVADERRPFAGTGGR